MLEIHSGPQPSQKRHVMDWFIQLFSYIKLHKLGLGSKIRYLFIAGYMTAGPVLWTSSWHMFLQVSPIPAVIQTVGFWVAPWHSLCLACWHLTSLVRSCFREHKARLLCLSTPKAWHEASQPFQSLACCTQGTTMHSPAPCDPLYFPLLSQDYKELKLH